MVRNPYDIWNAYFRFDEGDDGKERPVLVLESDKFFSLSAEITSHDPRDNCSGDVEIINWAAAGLKKPSTVRLSKQLDLTDFDFTYRIGRLHPMDVLMVQAEL